MPVRLRHSLHLLLACFALGAGVASGATQQSRLEPTVVVSTSARPGAIERSRAPNVEAPVTGLPDPVTRPLSADTALPGGRVEGGRSWPSVPLFLAHRAVLR